MVIQQEAHQSYVSCSPTKLSELILGKCCQNQCDSSLDNVTDHEKKKTRMDPRLKDCHTLTAYHLSVCHTPNLLFGP
jgi:hypothetical protein